MSDFNYIEYLKNNPLKETNTQSSKLITESQEMTKNVKMAKSKLKEKIREEILSALNEEENFEALLDEDKKEDEEEDEMDTEVDVDMDVATEEPTPAPASGLSAEEQEIQNSLKIAYDNAAAIGDEKLANQIGNSITFFTRTHIVER